MAAADPSLCLAHLPTFFGEAKHGWSSDHAQVAVAATTALKAVCNECVKPNMEEYAADKGGEEKLRKAFSNVLEGLGYQYHAAWAQVRLQGDPCRWGKPPVDSVPSVPAAGGPLR